MGHAAQSSVVVLSRTWESDSEGGLPSREHVGKEWRFLRILLRRQRGVRSETGSGSGRDPEAEAVDAVESSCCGSNASAARWLAWASFRSLLPEAALLLDDAPSLPSC